VSVDQVSIRKAMGSEAVVAKEGMNLFSSISHPASMFVDALFWSGRRLAFSATVRLFQGISGFPARHREINA